MAAALPSHDSFDDINKMTLFGSWNDLPAITQLSDESGMLRNFSTNELLQLGSNSCSFSTHNSFSAQPEQPPLALLSPSLSSDWLGSPKQTQSLEPVEPPPQVTPRSQATREAIEKMRLARSYVASLAPDNHTSVDTSVLEAMRSCASRDPNTSAIQGKLSRLTSVSSRTCKLSPGPLANPFLVPSVLPGPRTTSSPPEEIPPTAKRPLVCPEPSPPAKRLALSSPTGSPMNDSMSPGTESSRLVVSPADVMAHVGNRLGRHLQRQMALQAALGMEPNNICLKVSDQGAVGVDLDIAGVLQCAGMNRKKKARCRNAALMEYVGPRPIYCAEHISLDPNALYHKCGLPISADKGPKLCKEIVLHTFKYCYKHIDQWLSTSLVGPAAIPETQSLLTTASSLLAQLEQEAARAKSEDSELYQRKSKLIPKYQSLVKTLTQHLQRLEGCSDDELQQHHHNTPDHKDSD